MLQPTIYNFQECLTLADNAGKNKHLMLGNGFSVSLFPNIFNYKALAERIKSERIQKLFASLKTNDFEFVMRRLTDALAIAQLYAEGTALSAKIKQDLNELKTTLIDVITHSHPANPQAIAEAQYASCYDFLKHFEGGKKYTFNYDLILYWVYMHFLDNQETSLTSNDGFLHPEDDQSIVTWEIGRELTQNLYYLHGAMHVFSDGLGVEKYTWINSGKTITEQVRESINKQKYPVFISEGTREHKLSRIMDNSYLGRGFSSLKSIQGNLFVFGHSLRDEDDHVFNLLNKESGVKNIFISLFGKIDNEGNQKIISKVEAWKQKHSRKNYYYYQAESVKVWG